MTTEKLENLILEEFGGFYEFAENYHTKSGETCDKFLQDNELVFFENSDVIYHDSYGYESSTLERVYLYKPKETYFMLYGTRQSYNGTEWHGIKEVKRNTKVISVWE